MNKDEHVGIVCDHFKLIVQTLSTYYETPSQAGRLVGTLCLLGVTGMVALCRVPAANELLSDLKDL
jgi:hypothetical protein